MDLTFLSSRRMMSALAVVMAVALLAGYLPSLIISPASAATVVLYPNALGDIPVGQSIPNNDDGENPADPLTGFPVAGPARWANLDDDPVHDGDTSFVETTGDDNGDLYALDNPTFATGTVIGSIELCAVMRRANSDQRGGFFGLKSGATESWGSKVEWPGIGSGNDTSYAQYCRTYMTDPDTSAAWTKPAVDALQVGFFSNDDFNSGLRATQIFVTVDYGEAASSVSSVMSSTGSSISSVMSSTGSSISSTGSSVSSMVSSSVSSTGGTIPSGPLCNGKTATIYVANGMIVGGRDDGDVYAGELRGSWGDDVIVGTEGADTIKGSAGDDTICGLGGDDHIDGGFGNDWIDGGSGNDVLKGGMGDDTLYGRDGDDILDGGMGADKLFGGAGNDRIDGKMGADVACGGAGDDILYGGMGDDRMDGGSGTDALDGGSFGSDQCVNAASAVRCALLTGTVPECAGE